MIEHWGWLAGDEVAHDLYVLFHLVFVVGFLFLLRTNWKCVKQIENWPLQHASEHETHKSSSHSIDELFKEVGRRFEISLDACMSIISH